MVSIFYSYVTNALNMVIFILFLLLLEPVLRKVFSAICLYRLWLVLLIGLLIPIRLEFTKALFYISSPRITVEDNKASDFVKQTYDEAYNSWAIINQSQNQLSADSKKVHYNTQKNNMYNPEQSLSERIFVGISNNELVLSIIWVLGVILFLSIRVIQYYRYVKWLKRLMVPIDQKDIRDVFNNCIYELKQNTSKYSLERILIKRDVAVCYCSVIQSPMTIGIIKPTILLPKDSFDNKELHLILKHELVHIYRRDSFIKIIQLIVLSLNWYNPLCYIVTRRLNEWCETSCDEQVLISLTRSDCFEYSKLLLKCVTPMELDASLFNMYGGKSHMKKRLFSIMDKRKKRTSRVLVVTMLGIIFTTVFVAVNRQENASASSKDDIVTQTSLSTVSAGKITSSSDSKKSTQTGTKGNKKVKKEEESEVKSASDKDSLRNSIVEYAKEAEGTPFLWGGVDLSEGVDCSGFVQTVYKKFDFELPRTSREQESTIKNVDLNSLLPGDLIFYADSHDNKVNHVAIYIGDNQVIHAKNAKVGVVIEDINYRTPYSAGRVISN